METNLNLNNSITAIPTRRSSTHVVCIGCSKLLSISLSILRTLWVDLTHSSLFLQHLSKYCLVLVINVHVDFIALLWEERGDAEMGQLSIHFDCSSHMKKSIRNWRKPEKMKHLSAFLIEKTFGLMLLSLKYLFIAKTH